MLTSVYDIQFITCEDISNGREKSEKEWVKKSQIKIKIIKIKI